MSYSYEFVADALADFQKLDLELQELVLDALESTLDFPPGEGNETHVVVRQFGNAGVRSIRLRLLWLREANAALVIDVESHLMRPFE